MADMTEAASRRLVLFDFDGTLADTVPVITRTARRVLLGHGLTDETLGDLFWKNPQKVQYGGVALCAAA